MSWTNTNIGGGGAFTAIARAIDGTLYVTGDVGGLYKSTDNGTSWVAIGSASGVNDQNLYGVACDPTDANRVYACGEGGISPRTGIIRSVNAGATWTELANANTGSSTFTEIQVAPSDANRVYAVYQTTFGSTASQLYRSTDRGATFTQVYSFTSAITNPRVSKLLIHPTNPNIVYAISGRESTPGSSGTKAILKSIDANATPPSFVRVGPKDSQNIAFLDIVSAAIDPNQPTTLYATTSAKTYKSIDSGTTWTVINDARGGIVTAVDRGIVLLDVLIGTETDYTANDIWGVVLTSYAGSASAVITALKGVVTVGNNPEVPLIAYPNETGLPAGSWYLRSTNNGALGELTLDAGSTYATAILASSATPSYLNSAGAYSARKVQPGGTTTKQYDIHDIFIDVYGNNTLVCVVDPNVHNPNVYSTVDKGSTWTTTSSASWTPGWKPMTGYGVYSNSLYGDSKTIFMLGGVVLGWVTSQFVYLSYDGGRTWNQCFTSSSGNDKWQSRGLDNSVPTRLAGEGTQIIYAGLYDVGITRSDDAGYAWKEINSTFGWGDGKGGNCHSIVADPSNTGYVWASQSLEQSDPCTLVRSANYGELWSDSATSFPTKVFGSNGVGVIPFISGLALDLSSLVGLRTLYCCVSESQTGNTGRLYRSIDNGVTWAPFGLAPLPTTGLRVVYANGALIAVAGENGLWISTDSGVTFVRKGLTTFPTTTEDQTTIYKWKWRGVHSLLIDGTDLWAVYYNAGTSGKGVYLSTNALTGGDAWTLKKDDPFARNIHKSFDGSFWFTSSSTTGSGGNKDSGSTGVWNSIDGGTTWVSQTSGLPWTEFAWPITSASDSSWVMIGQTGTGFWKK